MSVVVSFRQKVIAAIKKNEPFEQLLKNEPERKNLLNMPNAGEYPLVSACCHGLVSPVRILLENGADPGIESEETLTITSKYKGRIITIKRPMPIHIAAIHGAPMVKCFTRSHITDVRRAGLFNIDNGMTPLLLASQMGHADVVKELIAWKTRRMPHKYPDWINTPNPHTLNTPLHYAVQENHNVACLGELLVNGADPNRRNSRGLTPALLAATDGRMHCFHPLSKAGADMNAATDANDTPISIAIGAAVDAHLEALKSGRMAVLEDRYVRCVKVLFELGAKPNPTPLPNGNLGPGQTDKERGTIADMVKIWASQSSGGGRQLSPRPAIYQRPSLSPTPPDLIWGQTPRPQVRRVSGPPSPKRCGTLKPNGNLTRIQSDDDYDSELMRVKICLANATCKENEIRSENEQLKADLEAAKMTNDDLKKEMASDKRTYRNEIERLQGELIKVEGQLHAEKVRNAKMTEALSEADEIFESWRRIRQGGK